jgi:beta-mannosidase
MTTRTALTTGWILNAVDADPSSPAAGLPESIPATVPGVVHTDLLAAGLIDDPYLDLNELKDDWIGHTTWRYSTSFEWTADGSDRTDLVFDGLDTVATVTLNGAELGRTFNQHRTYRFDVGSALREGPNELEVTFGSAWEYAERLERELGPRPNAFPKPYNFIRKMACNFGWDWGPELVTAGIWKDVRLESWSGARLDGVITTVGFDGDAGTVTVAVTTERVGDDALELELSAEGVTASAVLVDGAATVELRVPGVERWWPRDMGGQPLYDLDIRLVRAGVAIDEQSKRIGFRTVELDTSEDESGSRFTFVINGVPTFIRGANWIPDDCFPSRLTAGRYRERIEQAVGANLNLLRVWGGGIYERDEFYDACDELGVLTWQDFLFACAAYSEESPIREEVEAEARDNVLRISSHASLVLWNGCNENIWGWFDWDWQKDLGDLSWGLGYYTEILPAIVAELAPATPYWAASPYSGTMEYDANEFSRGNVHIWDVWNRVDYSTYATYEPRFVSEFGFQGPPARSTISRAIHDEPLTPESAGMLLHQKAADGNGKLERGMAPHLPEGADFDDWHYLTQLNQSRAVVFGIERYRSQRPHCMGTIVWQLNDCWPVTSWAAVDGYGVRKPLWHGLRRANDPRLLTIQPGDDGLSLFVVNDSITEWRVVAEVERMSFGGEVHARQSVDVTVPALSQARIPLDAAVQSPDDERAEVVVARSEGRRPAVRPFVEDRDLALEPAELEVDVAPWADGAYRVTVSSPTFTRGVSLFPDVLDPDAWADDSDLDLLPGVPATIVIGAPRQLDPFALASGLRSLNGLVESSRV